MCFMSRVQFISEERISSDPSLLLLSFVTMTTVSYDFYCLGDVIKIKICVYMEKEVRPVSLIP